MMVNSPLEIYATAIGVKMYNDLFNILVAFGIAFIPLLMIFFDGMSVFFESPFPHASSFSLKKLGFRLFLYIFTIMIFVAPTHKLEVSDITYQPVCSKDAAISKAGDTGTTYDSVFSDFQYDNIRLPLGLLFVLTGASGITNAAIVSLPCKTDVEAIQHTITTTTLSPDLSQQAQRFQNECYLAAKSQFYSKMPEKNTYQAIMQKYGGQADLSWIGSHVLQNLYYGNLYPTSPVHGFPYTEFPYKYGDFNEKAGVPKPKWGFPTCMQWWNNPEYGLKARLVQTVKERQSHDVHSKDKDISEDLNQWLNRTKSASHTGMQLSAQDVIAYNLLYNPSSESNYTRLSFHLPRNWADNSLYATDPIGAGSIADSAARIITGGFSQAGQGLEAVASSAKRAEIAQEIPILQAILMAICLSFGPLIFMLGGYRFHVIFSYSFILSSIVSVTFLERLIHYIEMSLHASMRYGIYALGNNFMLYNVFTKLYLFAPLIYLMLMSVCGVQAGNALRDVFKGPTSGSGGDLMRANASVALKNILK